MTPAFTDVNSKLSKTLPVFLAALLFALGGCEYDSPLTDVRCETAADCADGSFCSEGFCTSESADASTSIVTVEVAPDSLTLGAGDSARLTATARTADGERVEDAQIEWSSSDPNIVEVDEEGGVAALAPGSVLVTAESEFGRGSAAITVTPRPAASVTVSPDPAVLEEGATLQLTTDVFAANGDRLDDRTVQWSIDDTSIATVDSSGILRGNAAGMTTVTAAAGASSGSATVEVTEADVAEITLLPSSAVIEVGQIFSINALLRDGTGRLLEGRSPTWSSEDTTVATVNDSGEVEAVGEGSTTIRASADGVEATALIDVRPVDVATLDVSPPAATLELGSTLTLTATAFSSGGNELTGRNVTWSSSDDTVATVDASGTVTPAGTGTVLISANAGNIQASAAITVIEPRADQITMTPSAVDVTVGSTTSLSVEVQDASGDPISSPDVTWSSDDEGVAFVDADGTVAARAIGSATITATSNGKTATATVTVIERSVASVQVVPSSATIEETQTVGLRVEARASDGTLLEGRAVSWSSADDTIASVDNSGVVTGVADGGPIDITATVDGESGTSAITVVDQPVTSVEVTPRLSTITTQDTLQLAATPEAADGTSLSGRTVTWTSTDTNVATVDASGLVTAEQPGLVIIEAEAGGTIGYASVRIEAAVGSVSVTPSSPSIDVASSVQLDATATDDQGDALEGRTFTWSSSDAAVATVDDSGLVTGVGEGSATITAADDASGVDGDAAVTVSWRFVAASTDYRHVCGVSTNDRTYCWGLNDAAQIGDGTATSRDAATQVRGDSGLLAVAAGYDHSCGLDSSGAAFCWGDNSSGQLGDATFTDSRTPIAVDSALSFSALAAGDGFTCGLTSAAELYCWGDGSDGQLGNNTSGMGTTSNTPVEVQLDYTNWLPIAVDLGRRHACALAESTGDSTDVRVFCWGDNAIGQLGDNSNSDRSTPVEVDHDFSQDTARSVAAGGDNGCMTVEDGSGTFSAECWGDNTKGQVGDDSTDDRNDPRPVSGDFEFTSVWVGVDHACGLLSDGTAKCWGDNSDGQLGDGTSGGYETVPVDVTGSLVFAQMGLGDDTSCALASDDTMYCWGDDGSGRLGIGGTGAVSAPTSISTP
ncbi:MAG: Ig-like domain-containing protein [Myxococcota bacterium]